MPPRFPPRDWIEPPGAFIEPERGEWRNPTSVDEAVELMVAHYLSQACAVVLEELERRGMNRAEFGHKLGLDETQTRRLRRKLNGEYPASLEDIFLWAVVLDRPDMLYAPGDVVTMLPDGIAAESVLAKFPSAQGRRW